MRARAQVQRLRKRAVHRDIFKAQMIVVAAMRGEKYEVQSTRGHAALMRDLKFENLQSIELGHRMIEMKLRIGGLESVHVHLAPQGPHGMRTAGGRHR